MITLYKDSDLPEIERIHNKFYKNEFSLSDFDDAHPLGKFVVRDDDDNSVITAVTIRAIAEAIAITDKDKSVRSRRTSLYHLLQASLFCADSYKFGQLHVSVQDPVWEKQLLKAGFRQTKGRMLVIDG